MKKEEMDATVVQDEEKPSIEEAPPVVEAEPEPDFLGTIEDSERKTITELQQQHQQMVYHLGRTVIGMFDVVNQVGGVEEQINSVYQSIAKRLNIEPTVQWSVLPDGTIKAVPTNVQAMPQKG